MTYRKPLSIRIVCVLMSLFMVISCLTDWSVVSEALGEDPITITIIDDLDVTHTGADKPVSEGGYGATVNFDGLKLNGEPIKDTDVLKDGDILSFSLEWNSGTFETATDDGTPVFKFVIDNLKKCKNVEPYFTTIEIDRPDSYATYSYDPANGQMTVTVKPKPGYSQGFGGSCDVDMTVNVNADDLEDGKISLSPLFDKTFTYQPGELTVYKATSGSLYKSGDSWYQDFTINLNVSSGTMNTIRITDTFEGDVFVGAPQNVALNDTSVDAAVSGNSFTVDIASLSGNNTLTYSLKVDPDAVTESIKNGDTTLNNNAKADYNNKVEDKTTPVSYADVWVSKPSVSKTGTFNQTTRAITWKITFDPGTVGMFADGDITTLTVKDTVGNNLSLADLKTGLDNAGITYTESGTDAVIINYSEFKDDGYGKFYVEYTTPAVDDAIIESADPKVKNSAEGTYKDIPLTKQTAETDVTDTTGTVGAVDKTLVSSDTDSLTIKWSIDIEIPAEGVIDSIKVIDGPGAATFRSDINMNVVNCTVLKGGIETFRYYIDGSEISYATLNAGSVIYKEIPADNLYGTTTTGTFESGKAAGFEFTLGSGFIESNRGKTLTVEYESVMDGERYQSAPGNPLTEDKYALINYKNHVDVEYYKGGIRYPNPPADEAEYVPSIDLAAGKYTYSGYNIFPDYGTGGEYPVLAYWEVRIVPKAGFTVGDKIVISDTVSSGNEFYPGSIRLFSDDGTSLDAWASQYETYISDDAKYDSQIAAAATGSKVTFTITVDDRIAAASAAGKRFRILYATAPSDEAVSRAVLYGGETINVSNTADVYHNDALQVKDINASQDLKASGEICGKTQVVDRGTDSDITGSVTYTLEINKSASRLAEDGKITVDDWLGGNLDIIEANGINISMRRYDENTPTVIHYDVVMNPDYDKSEGSIRDFFYLNGTKLADSMIIKTGVGTKMRFVLDDQTAYTITYDCVYDKINAYLSPVEEEARFSNTVVIHNSSKDSISRTVSISYSDYHSKADVYAATNRKNIIFDIKKDWKNDNIAERPEKITLHVLKTNLSTGETESYDTDIIVHDNAAIQEDGTWLFSLKLLGWEKTDGNEEIFYSYTIDEEQIEGYATNWSTAFDDITVPNDLKDSNYVVSTVLTNTAAAKFVVSKMDITEEHELEGASIAIYKASDVGPDNKPLAGKSPVKNWISDGTEKTISLANGDYVLIETGSNFTDSTTGKTYKVTESAVRFTIDETGVKSVTGNKTGAVTDTDKDNGFITYSESTATTPQKFIIHDAEAKKATLEVSKKDITGQEEVKGAKISVYNAADIVSGKPKSGAVPVETWVSGDGGDTHTFVLGDGEYVLIETSDDGKPFVDESTHKKYLITDSYLSFTVSDGAITSADVTDGTSGTIDYNNGVAKVCDAEVPKVLISKTDMTGNTELSGAVLQLFDSDGKQIGADHTSEVGVKWEVGPLDAGTYTVKETVAPDGFKKLTTDVTFTVDEKGQVTGVTGSSEFKNGVVLIEDTISKIAIYKRDATGGIIPETNKATFRLTITEPGKTLDGVKFGADGSVELSGTSHEFEGNTAIFTGLKNGKYTIEELTAPNGFKTIAPLSFTVENGVVKPFGSGDVTNGTATVDANGNLSIINTAKGNITIAVTKSWTGDNVGIASVTAELYKVGPPDTKIDTKTLNAANGWSSSFSVEEDSGTYYIKETAVTKTGFEITTTYKVGEGAETSDKSADIDSTADASVTIINNATEIPDTSATIVVKKQWQNDQGTALAGADIPVSSVSVRLHAADGTEVGAPVEISKTNDWQYIFTGLTVGSDYYVEEITTGDFVTTYSPASTTTGQSGTVTASKGAKTSPDITITNQMPCVKINVNKSWTGAETGIASVTAELYRVGTPDVKVDTATLSSTNNWSAEFSVLKNSGSYYVKETAVTKEGFGITTTYKAGAGAETSDKSANIDSAANAAVTITNHATVIPDTSAAIVVKKKWQNEQGNALDAANIPVNSVSVQLYMADGTEVGAPVEITKTNDWQYIFTGLTVGSDYYVKETTTGDFVTTYAPAATTTELSGTVTATKGAKTSPDITITNKRESIKIAVTKSWTGDDAGIASITAELYKVGTPDVKVDTATLSSANNWTAEFSVFKNSGTYYVKEPAVTKAGFTITTTYRTGAGAETSDKSADIESTANADVTITNNAAIVNITISVTKNWTGDDTGITSVIAELHRSDGVLVESKALSIDNGWKADFTVQKDSGEYYITEVAVSKDGYTITSEYKVGTGETTSGKSSDISSSSDVTAVITNNAVRNPVVSEITIIKTDMNGNPVAASNKAKFRLTVLSDGVTLDGVTVDGELLGAVKTFDYESNSVTFTGLLDGNYTLDEERAPIGFISAGTVKFNITAGKVQIDTTVVNTFAAIDGNGNLRIMNKRIPDVPTIPTNPVIPQYPSETTAPTPGNTPVPEEITNPDDTEEQDDTTVPEEITAPEDIPDSDDDTDEDTDTDETEEADNTYPDNPKTPDNDKNTGSAESNQTNVFSSDDNPHTGKEFGVGVLLVSELAVLLISRKRKNGRKDK